MLGSDQLIGQFIGHSIRSGDKMANLSLKKPLWIYSRRCDVHWNLPRDRKRCGHQIKNWNRAAFCKQQGHEFEQTTSNGQKYSQKRWLMTF